jgi:hypothetical protein
MELIGKDLMTARALRDYVDKNLKGFQVEVDEISGELVIRTNLTVDDDGMLADLSGTGMDDVDETVAPFKRVWYASPNGDWWGGSPASGYIYRITEDQIPEGYEEYIEEDKFEDVILEYGTKLETYDLLPVPKPKVTGPVGPVGAMGVTGSVGASV